jgi:3-deoxy-D-manno-octulosonic-acid transferase
MMSKILYNLFIRLLGFGMFIARLFNPKAKKWHKGRKNWQIKLRDLLKDKIRKNSSTIWMHASSLGEYEQGRPILEKLRSIDKNINILVSFYSPSGFEPATKNKEIDVLFYLPLDTKSNAKDLLSIIKPNLVLWIKYEYWWNILESVSSNKIPLLLISALFKERQLFFKWYGKWYGKMLECFTHLFVQTEQSKLLATGHVSAQKITVSGDTRFDRVVSIASSWQPVNIIENWIGDTAKVVVAGSTWHDDEKVLKHLIEQHQDIKWIIVPHKIDQWSMNETKKIFYKKLIYSELVKNPNESEHSNLLIIDTIGVLSRIYRYGSICYIGGGFTDTGIHNSLEAAVYGKPLIFGPEFQEYVEAIGLIQEKAAYSFENVLELEEKFELLLNNREVFQTAVNASKSYVYRNAGATSKIVEYIYKNRLLTNT